MEADDRPPMEFRQSCAHLSPEERLNAVADLLARALCRVIAALPPEAAAPAETGHNRLDDVSLSSVHVKAAES